MAVDSLPGELQSVLEDHKKVTEAICNSISDDLASMPTPSIIYHYTDDHGLKGILETGRLWFTDLFNLNDPSELNHGIRLALDVLKSAADTGPPEVKLFYDHFTQVLDENIEKFAHFFVCCFSKTDKDLGQWRAYADDGRGYAIGFDAGVLEKAFETASSPGSISTFPVTYCDKRLCEIHEQLVKETIPAISAPHGKTLSGEMIPNFMSSLSTRLATSFSMVSLFFKHEAYINEQEYRFLQIYRADKAVPDLKFRSRPYSLVRYREFEWKCVAAESIKEVICGPASDQNIARRFADDCLREYLPSGEITSIKRSEIPYKSDRR